MEAANSKPTLGYWAIRGLASQIRYQMVYLGVDYNEDIYEQGDAPEFSRAQWFDVKNSLGLAFPNLPYMLDGDMKVTETLAIMKYICNKNGPELLGKDSQQVGKVEMVASNISELKGAVTMPCYTVGDKSTITTELLKKVVPIINFLGEKPFLCGDNVTYPDFIFFELCDLMQFISDGQLFERFPVLENYWMRVKELPRLKEYYEDDTKCIKRPFNNKIAKINN